MRQTRLDESIATGLETVMGRIRAKRVDGPGEDQERDELGRFGSGGGGGGSSSAPKKTMEEKGAEYAAKMRESDAKLRELSRKIHAAEQSDARYTGKPGHEEYLKNQTEFANLSEETRRLQDERTEDYHLSNIKDEGPIMKSEIAALDGIIGISLERGKRYRGSNDNAESRYENAQSALKTVAIGEKMIAKLESRVKPGGKVEKKIAAYRSKLASLRAKYEAR